jgi:hypothetical protein
VPGKRAIAESDTLIKATKVHRSLVPENGDSKAIIQAMTETRKRRLPRNNPPAHHLWSSSDAYENAIVRPYEEGAARRSSDLAESNLEKSIDTRWKTIAGTLGLCEMQAAWRLASR